MAIADYDGLKAAVAAYLGRSDLTDRIPDFIRLAELRLDRELRLRDMERTATATAVPGQAELWLPDDRTDGAWNVFMEMRELALADAEGGPLEYVPPGDVPSGTGVQGRPVRYTIIGRALMLSPVPDAAYPLALAYYAEIPPLSAVQATNDVLLRAPDLYLYASLAEACVYTRSTAPQAMWEAKYADARDRLQETEQKARYTSRLAMSPIRRI